jgi:hypothetical protein
LLSAQIKVNSVGAVHIGRSGARINVNANSINMVGDLIVPLNTDSDTDHINNDTDVVPIETSMLLLTANFSDKTINIGNSETFLNVDVTNKIVNMGNAIRVNTGNSVVNIGNPESSLGFMVFQSMDVIDLNFSPYKTRPVMALTGLDNKQASIGRSTNQMSRIYSDEFYASGAFIGTLISSDANLKTNISELSPITERIMKLRPVMYDFVRDGSGRGVSRDDNFKNRVGFIAQEVQDYFPDLVKAYKLGDDENAEELLSLDYAGLIPYLTKAIQELSEIVWKQSETIEDLIETVEQQQQQISDIQTGVYMANFVIDAVPGSTPQGTQSPSATLRINSVEANILFQNVPNPFNSATTITYRLAEKTINAKICIYNLTGKQLQCYNLPAVEGENSIEVRASSLQSGMYLYSLIVDGRLIDTKRMVLTE